MVASDHIIIFFTQNARKIDMAEIANHGAAELKMIEIPAGKLDPGEMPLEGAKRELKEELN